MTVRSAAVYGSCGAVLVACLAAANMPSQDAQPAATPPRRPQRATPDAIAVDVQSQAARLRSRMADAPTPAGNPRNPFSFAAARMSRAANAPNPLNHDATVHAAVADQPVTFTPAPPQLVLMGMAEDSTPAGPRRTAIIGGEGDELIFAREGDVIAGRYKVTKIGVDAVELEDQTNKAYRRLGLR